MGIRKVAPPDSNSQKQLISLLLVDSPFVIVVVVVECPVVVFAMGFFVWLVFTALWAGVGGVLPMFLPTHEHRPLINVMLKITAIMCYTM